MKHLPVSSSQGPSLSIPLSITTTLVSSTTTTATENSCWLLGRRAVILRTGPSQSLSMRRREACSSVLWTRERSRSMETSRRLCGTQTISLTAGYVCVNSLSLSLFPLSARVCVWSNACVCVCCGKIGRRQGGLHSSVGYWNDLSNSSKKRMNVAQHQQNTQWILEIA